MSKVEARDEVRCINCGSAEHLVVVPHRNDLNNIVGLIYVCPECFGKIEGGRVLVRLLPAGSGENTAKERI